MKRMIIIISLIFIMLNINGCSNLIITNDKIGQGISENNELVYDDIVNEIIRFHVLANSDSDEDQKLKLKVRDKVIEYVSEGLKSCTDLDEARSFIVENKSTIETIAKNVVDENGYSYSVTSMLSRENFPDKVYGDLVFPQGEYEAYRILIGNSEGQNWWCVMFPPLCFVDGTKDAVDSKEIEEKLNETKNKKAEEKNIEEAENKKIEEKDIQEAENKKKEEKDTKETENKNTEEKKVQETKSKIKFKSKIFEVLFGNKEK